MAGISPRSGKDGPTHQMPWHAGGTRTGKQQDESFGSMTEAEKFRPMAEETGAAFNVFVGKALAFYATQAGIVSSLGCRLSELSGEAYGYTQGVGATDEPLAGASRHRRRHHHRAQLHPVARRPSEPPDSCTTGWP